jgi:hypothetical protein
MLKTVIPSHRAATHNVYRISLKLSLTNKIRLLYTIITQMINHHHMEQITPCNESFLIIIRLFEFIGDSDKHQNVRMAQSLLVQVRYYQGPYELQWEDCVGKLRSR